MRKTIITSVIALVAIIAMPLAAQTDTNTNATKTEKKHQDRRGHQRGANPFEGITLNDTQKEALKALTPQRPEHKGQRHDSVKARRLERPEHPIPTDTAYIRHNPKHMRAEYVKKVKEILTSEQYVVFLENIVINDAQIPGNRMGKVNGRHGKNNKPGKPGKKKDNR